jgi:hypothetical protein
MVARGDAAGDQEIDDAVADGIPADDFDMTIFNAASDIGVDIRGSESDLANRTRCGASSTRCPPTNWYPRSSTCTAAARCGTYRLCT